MRGWIWTAFLCGLLAACEPPSAQPPAAPESAPVANEVASPADPQHAAPASVAVSPAARVQAFAMLYQEMRFRGLPDAARQERLSEHFSARLRALFGSALEGQSAYRARYPTDKPPMIDGDIFSSLFEGATATEVAQVAESGDSATVTVAQAYNDAQSGKVLQRWQDRFLLVRETGGDWRIDDIEYLGGWDFAPRGRLSAALEETAALP